ncbi:MAG: lactate racemase domain-containing protein, partial [Tannerellaceae bacterium]|nr:lactate racemase domain-containing protein [Tannerellaceae bacterium]
MESNNFQLIYAEGDPDKAFSSAQLKESLFKIFDRLGRRTKVLVIPPDFTRFHSRAGELTCYAYEYYGRCIDAVMPALGTHAPMAEAEIGKMFPGVPQSLFKVHNWRDDVVTVGETPAEYVAEASEGAVDYPWPAQVNRLLFEGGYDLILSIGQVVPHEVIGMANYNKNIFVGTGGADGINKSHFIGAAYGMERIMGRADNPVRMVMNYANRFIAHLPIIYIQTVVSGGPDGLQVRGLYAGSDSQCFELAAKLSLKVNFKMMDREMRKVVVYLDPEEFKTT